MENLSPKSEEIMNKSAPSMDKMEDNAEQDEIIIKCSLENMAKAFFKDYEIIWHDPKVNSQENQQYLGQLKELCEVKTFTERKEAEDYIKNAKTVCYVITSGTNGELFVKEIFSSQNVPKILTFCRDEVSHSAWAKKDQKVENAVTTIDAVVSLIQNNLLEWQKQVSSFRLDLPAFAPIFDDRDKSQMNHLHLYLKVLPKFNNRAQAKKDFVSLSKRVYTDKENSQLIEYFERTYDEYDMKVILKWYTRQSFLYKLINNCLRVATSDSIQYCRFLLKDVESAIRDQYQAKSKNFSGLLYRGAYLSAEEWSSLKANVKREIEMHGFLSVSKKKDVALEFVESDSSKKVLITILVPKGPNEEEQGFAEVAEFSDFPREQEVLFNVRSRFTVLETNDDPYRHLILLYGAQSLRRFVADKKPLQQVSIEDIKNASGSRCQGPISEMDEVMLFKSLKDPKKPIYSCKGCLDPRLAPFLCVPPKGKMPMTIEGCLLMNPHQTQIPWYGYQCSKCGAKDQKGYFVCTDCSEKKMKWCENCFEQKLDCIEAGHSVILETFPFSFWSDKMSEKELNHLNFQNDLVRKGNLEFQQAKMYIETHEFEKAIKYCQLILQQHEENVKNVQLANAHHFLGDAYRNQGEFDKALESYFESLDMSKLIYGENHPEVAISYGNIGLVFCKMAEYNKALEYDLKSLKIKKLIYAENHPDIATSYNNIGGIYKEQGEYEKALQWYLKSLEITKSVYKEKRPDIAVSYLNIGSIYRRQGDYDKALEYHFKSLDVHKSIYGEKYTYVATCYNNIGSIYQYQGEYKKALEFYFKSLDIYKSIYGEKHPDIAALYNNIGLIYNKMADYHKAFGCYLKSVEIGTSVHGKNHPQIAIFLNNIGFAFKERKEYDKALEFYFRSLDIDKSVYGEKHHTVSTSYVNIGSVLFCQRKYNQALEYYFKSLDIDESVQGENNPKIASSCNEIGSIYQEQAEYDKALEYYMKSLEIRKSIYGEKHFKIAASYLNIGLVYQKQGQYDQALIFLFKSLEIDLSVYGENHLGVATSYDNIGLVYDRQGEYDEALGYYLKSIEIKKSFYGEKHRIILISYLNIARMYKNQRKPQNIIEYNLKALEICQSVYGEDNELAVRLRKKVASLRENRTGNE